MKAKTARQAVMKTVKEMTVGDEPVREIVELEFATERLRILSPTDCVKDRLTGYYFWKDMQCLEQAILVAAANEVDMEEIERWSGQEGMLDEFIKIKGRLVNKSNDVSVKDF